MTQILLTGRLSVCSRFNFYKCVSIPTKFITSFTIENEVFVICRCFTFKFKIPFWYMTYNSSECLLKILNYFNITKFICIVYVDKSTFNFLFRIYIFFFFTFNFKNHSFCFMLIKLLSYFFLVNPFLLRFTSLKQNAKKKKDTTKFYL